MKICTKCGESKEPEMFYKQNKNKDGLNSKCKLCVKISNEKYYKNNAERVKERMSLNNESNADYRSVKAKIRYKKNREKILSNQNNYNTENKNKIATRMKVYAPVHREKNRNIYNQRSAARRALKLKAIIFLTEADLCKIKEIYMQARLLSLNSNIKYHVDHIVPLKGKTVCGLHVPWNLQIITATENHKKTNKLVQDSSNEY